MNVENLVRQFNTSYNQQIGSISTDESQTAQTGLQKGLERVLNSTGGTVLSGQVVSVDGENLVLSLAEGELLNARLEGSLKPALGQLLSFEVKENQGGTVQLSPLFTNTAQASTVNNALLAAGLPQNAQNQYMVKSMMGEGLPIDKASLYSMSQAMVNNATADVLDLAKMTRLNIPLTPEMVEEFNVYKNYEHEITGALNDIGESFSDSVCQAFEKMPFEKALEFTNISANILLPELFEENTSKNGANDLVENSSNMVGMENEIFGENEGQKALQGASVAEGASAYSQMKVSDEMSVFSESIVSEENDVSYPVSRDVAKSVIKDASVLGLPRSLVEEAKAGNLTSKDLLKAVLSAVKGLENESLDDQDKAFLSSKLTSIFENGDFKNLLKKEITKNFLLKPDEIAQDGKVSKLYERLNNEIKLLSDEVSQMGVKNSPLQNAVNNLSMNMDFMNELNQTFNYVQIPLKLSQNEACGELYVYSNKKSLAKNDGNVSALLHLDMEHLGSVDVHVALNTENNVKTRFFFKDDASLDLIAENIEILNKRLEKRGYNMTSEFVMKEENKPVFDTILEDNKNISLISTGSFDARA